MGLRFPVSFKCLDWLRSNQEQVRRQRRQAVVPASVESLESRRILNAAPISLNDSYQIGEDELFEVGSIAGVLANDTDSDNDTLFAIVSEDPSHGQLTLNEDGAFQYQPLPNYFGLDSFQYFAFDGSTISQPATVTIAVQPINDAPVVNDDKYQGLLRQSLSVSAGEGVLANDSDVENAILTAELQDEPQFGSVMLNPDGSFTYVPGPSASDRDSFTYRARDASDISTTATVSLSFVGDDTYSTSAGVSLDAGLVNGGFESNDLSGWTTFTNAGGTLGGVGFPDTVLFDTSESDVRSLSAQFLAGNGGGGLRQDVFLAGGTVQINVDVAVRSLVSSDEAGKFLLSLDGTVVASHDFGTIAANRTLRHRLVGTVTDVTSGMHEIAVNIIRDGASVFAESPLSYVDNVLIFGNAGGVLANDRVENLQSLRPLLLEDPAHGLLDLRDDGSFRYVPDSGFVGLDQFTYKPVAHETGLSFYSVDTASDKLLTVDSVNGETTVIGAVGHDMGEVDLVYTNDTLYALNRSGGRFELLTLDPTTGAMLSLVRLKTATALRTAKGITAVDGQLYVVYSAQANYCGNNCFAAHILGRLDPGTGIIEELVNYRSLDGGFRHDFDALATNATGDIVGHRRANDEVIQTYVLGFEPPRLVRMGEVRLRQIAGVNDAVEVGKSQFLLSNQARGFYRFAPETTGFSIVRELIDVGAVGSHLSGLAFAPQLETDATNVNILITSPDAPNVEDDAYTIGEDNVLTVAPSRGVLANDPKSESLQARLSRAPLHGHIELRDDGSFDYHPAEHFWGSDFFQYQADDGVNRSNVATVEIAVSPINDAPVAMDDSYRVFVNDTLIERVESGLLANDFDADGDSISFQVLSDVARGILTTGRGGTFAYRPEPGFVGIDQFTYSVNDGRLESNVATVTIDVRSAPPPVAIVDRFETNEDQGLSIERPADGILANDQDARGRSLSAVLAKDVEHGNLTLQPDGTFDYVPHTNFFGEDSFTYFANNGTSDSNAQGVTIVVHSVNDAPVAREDDYLVTASGTLSIEAASGVLANDSDPESDQLSARLVDAPSHGTVTLNADGAFEYRAGDDFTSVDQFTYHAFDGFDQSELATVFIRADLPQIVVGEHILRANQPNQTIQVFVTGGQQVAGAELFVMIGDGGPDLVELGLPAGNAGPMLTNVDVKSKTIFSTIVDEPVDLGSFSQIANWSIAASAVNESVTANGLLATLTIDTTGFLEGTWDLAFGEILPRHPFGPFNTGFAGTLSHIVNGSITVVPTQVVGRHIFYNNSRWDGHDVEADVSDAAAIASDKTALFPNQQGTFANYTNYSGGINGVLIDVQGLPDPQSLTLADFEFRVGRNDSPDTWAIAPNPQLSVRANEGIDNSDRVTLTWPDNLIQQQWLEVRIKANANTLLTQDDVFYFGNSIGETGNSTNDTFVNAIDVIAARDNQRGPFDLTSVTNVFDFNRDGLVSSIDVIIARDNQTGPLNALPLITPAADSPAAALARERRSIPGDLNYDQTVDGDDIDLLWAGIRAGNTGLDINIDGHVNLHDMRFLVEDILGTTIGDVNLDGAFDSRDLVHLFQVGEYEDDIRLNSTWTDGDFDLDGEFSSADLIIVFQFGGYGANSAAASSRPSATDIVSAVRSGIEELPALAAFHQPRTALSLSNLAQPRGPVVSDWPLANDSLFDSEPNDHQSLPTREFLAHNIDGVFSSRTSFEIGDI